jgi:quinol monooxygenase YgiN
MSAAGEITIVARWLVADGAMDEVMAIVAELRPKSLGEEGCLGYEVYQAVRHPRGLLLLERYRDDAALEAHRQSAHYQALVVHGVVPLLEERQVEVFKS